MKIDDLPRQARDKQQENSTQVALFCAQSQLALADLLSAAHGRHDIRGILRRGRPAADYQRGEGGRAGAGAGVGGRAGFDDDGDLSCDWWRHLVLHQREFTVSDVTATTRLSACLPLPGYLPACLSGCPGAWLLACFAPFRHPAGRQLATRTI